MAESCRVNNFGVHVGNEARDGALLSSRHDSWAHVPIKMKTSTALYGISTTGTSCSWTWRLLES